MGPGVARGATVTLWWLLPLVALLSLALTGWVRREAEAWGLLDIPNARSAHSRATPRGGGLAIVVAFFGALVVLVVQEGLEWHLWWALLGAGAVAAVGFLDDRRSVPVRWRLLTHGLAAVWALAWVGEPPVVMFGQIVDLGGWGHVLAALYLVWLLNLYNFMDGIDGLAGVETITVAAAAAFLYLLSGASGESLNSALVPAVLAAAALGFLCWNFPPARIFMGDVGSGFVGLVFGILSLEAAVAVPRWLWVWLVLLAVFVVDATGTVLIRLARGARLSEAHSGHAYQMAARRWGHRHVTIAVAAINLCWLTPLAALIALDMLDGATAFVIACMPLALLMAGLRAGELTRGAV